VNKEIPKKVLKRSFERGVSFPFFEEKSPQKFGST
jgi:hypothetical protein